MARCFLKSCRNIIDTQGEVMQSLAATGDKSTQVGLGGQRLEQLDPRWTNTEEGDTNIGETLVALHVKAQARLEMWAG
jgi:hypothetical protein